MTGIRVCVTGGREYNDERNVNAVLDDLHRTEKIALIIHGACPSRNGKISADMLANAWALRNRIPVDHHPADWALGKKAGPIRNGEMVALRPDVVVAFMGDRGTRDMVRQSKAAGLRVECGCFCDTVYPYGFVPEADCPVHDAPKD